MEEKKNTIRESPFMKGLEFIRKQKQPEYNDNTLELIILYLIEIERRKGISYNTLLKDYSLKRALTYISQNTLKNFYSFIEPYSDLEVNSALDRCFSLLSRGEIDFIRVITSKEDNLNIAIDTDIIDIPLYKLITRERKLGIHNNYYINIENAKDNENQIILEIFKYLFKDEIKVINNYIKYDYLICDTKSYINNKIPLDDYLNKNTKIIIFNSDINLKEVDPLDKYFKDKKVELIVKSERFNTPYYSFLILSNEIECTYLVSFNSLLGARFRHLSTFDFYKFIEESAMIILKDKIPSIGTLYKALLFEFDIFSDVDVKRIPLKELVKMRYASTQSFFESEDGEIAFIADRTCLDENGGIVGYGKEDNNDIFSFSPYQKINKDKYISSLLHNEEIYLTRKTSSIKIGIYNKDILRRFTPRKYIENGLIDVYIFASAVILTVNKDLIDPYYLFAVLYYQNKKSILVKNSSNDLKHQFFTKDSLGEILIPVLSKGEMELIGEEFKKYYIDYLNSINQKDIFAQRMENLLISSISKIKK